MNLHLLYLDVFDALRGKFEISHALESACRKAVGESPSLSALKKLRKYYHTPQPTTIFQKAIRFLKKGHCSAGPTINGKPAHPLSPNIEKWDIKTAFLHSGGFHSKRLMETVLMMLVGQNGTWEHLKKWELSVDSSKVISLFERIIKRLEVSDSIGESLC